MNKQIQHTFSIIIPIYNTPIIFLKKCIDSCLNQDYKNYEIILINDCSTDIDTLEYISKLHNKKIKIINNETNIGLGPSRNVGIKNSKNDYLIFVDSDDWIDHSCLSILNKKIYGYDLISFNIYWVKKGVEHKNKDYVYKYNNINIWAGETTWSKAYRREYLIKNNIYFHESRHYHEDIYFALVVFRFNPKLISIDNPLYFYNRDNDKSITSIESTDRIFKDISCLIKNFSLRKEDNLFLREWYTTYVANVIPFWFYKNNIMSKKVFVKYSKNFKKNIKYCNYGSKLMFLKYKIWFSFFGRILYSSIFKCKNKK